MNTLIARGEARGPWRLSTWKQGIFLDRIPWKFNHFKRVWTKIRTVVLWALQIERNDRVFQGASWKHLKLLQIIWNGIVHYRRVEWYQVQWLARKNPRGKWS